MSHKRRGRGILDMAKRGLALSKQYGVARKLSSMSDPRAKLAGQVLAAVGGRLRRHRRSRR